MKKAIRNKKCNIVMYNIQHIDEYFIQVDKYHSKEVHNKLQDARK